MGVDQMTIATTAADAVDLIGGVVDKKVLIAAVLFGLAALVVLSRTGGSIAFPMIGMTVTVNTPSSD